MRTYRPPLEHEGGLPNDRPLEVGVIYSEVARPPGFEQFWTWDGEKLIEHDGTLTDWQWLPWEGSRILTEERERQAAERQAETEARREQEKAERLGLVSIEEASDAPPVVEALGAAPEPRR